MEAGEQGKIQNSKHEIRNKSEIQRTNDQNTRVRDSFGTFLVRILEFVSDFDIRISCFLRLPASSLQETATACSTGEQAVELILGEMILFLS
jgi:hypothetical protein